MAWDASRPVPWRQLVVPFLIYAVVANAAFLLFFRDRYGPAAILGTAIGGAVYLAVTVVMVKFGWQPTRLKVRDNARASKEAAAGAPAKAKTTDASAGGRPKPPPTKRTNATNPRAKPRR